MQEFIIDHYLLFKALHIISVIAWMAGLLYLPRLFVYHASSETGSAQSETFKVMEYRLYRYIMTPAFVATWAFGLLMLYGNFDALIASGWMHMKLMLVIFLTGAHHIFGAWMKKFASDQNARPPKFYKIWNEVPTVLMIVIVLLAVTKPF